MLVPRNPIALSWMEIIRAIFSFRKESQIEYFGKAISNYLNVRNVILVSSGRLALYFILKALLKEGDKLIVPAFTCNVILGAIKTAGVKPVFADVDIGSFNMGVKYIKQVFGPDIKAILMTHQFGLPCDVDEIIDFAKKNKVLVIEDAAPALGAKYKGKLVGVFGDVGFFSFENSKVISTYEGGAIVTRRDDIFTKTKATIRNLKGKMSSNNKILLKLLLGKIMLNPYLYSLTYKMWQLISREKYSSAEKLDLEDNRYLKPAVFTPFRATLGLLQLKKIDKILKIREKTAELYSNKLLDFTGLQLQTFSNDRTHTYARYAVLLKDIDKYKFHDMARRKGVDLGFTFSYICPQYYEKEYSNYKNSLYIANHILNIPITMNKKLNKHIISQVRQIL